MEFTIFDPRMAAEQQTQLLAEPKEVDVVGIERELVRLWKEASEESADTLAVPVVRACALNFIVVTEREQDVQELAEMVGDVTIEHPARIFLIVADPRNTTAKLDAWISARCSLPVPGGKQVCCEQITLTALGTEAPKIPSIVTSLLVPDVPSVLLWKSEVRERDPVLHALADVVNRVLIDSSDNPAPEKTLLAWGAFLAGSGSHVTFGDLAWTHLTPWRSVVANAFNPLSMRPLLKLIETVTVEYSSSAAPRHSGLSQAWLFVSWLTEKLQWSVTRGLRTTAQGEYTATLQQDGRIIHVRIVPVQPREGRPGGIESVSLGMQGSASLHVAATPHPHCVALTRRSEHGVSEELVTVLSDKSEAALVAQELEVMSRDPGYEAVVRKLMEVFA